MNIDGIIEQATAASADALRLTYIRKYGDGGRIYNSIQALRNQVRAHIALATLINGRRPGRFPPWGYEQGGTNRTALMKWAMEKFNVDEKSAKQISYLVARKLKMYGSDIWRGLKPKLDTEEARQAGVLKMQQILKEELRNKIK